MKIVCICEDETLVNFIREGLSPAHEVPLIIVPKFASRKQRKPRKLSAGEFVSKAISKLFFTFVSRSPSSNAISDMIESVKATNDKGAIDQPKSVEIMASKINSRSTAELIAEHEPDLMFVCGAPILKKSIFDIPKYGSVNFHFGYSPKYRGHHGLLWPLIRKDYENLAGTFLKIDAGVDTGTPLGFLFPEVNGSDTLETIEVKVAKMAHDSIADVMNSVESDGMVKHEQPTEQFQIKYLDYKPTVHFRYHLRRKANKLFASNEVLRPEKIILKSKD